MTEKGVEQDDVAAFAFKAAEKCDKLLNAGYGYANGEGVEGDVAALVFK